VLVPSNPNARNYGRNPYVGYDATGQQPFLYDGSLPDGIEPMERVVAVEVVPGRHEAWALALLRRSGAIESADLLLQWQPGQASALDKATIPAGRDVGNVIVQRRQDDQLADVPYDVAFAFVFHAVKLIVRSIKTSPILKASNRAAVDGWRQSRSALPTDQAMSL